MNGLATRAMRPADWPAVERIYADGIATGNATFEDHTPSWDNFDQSRIPTLRLVAVDVDGVVLGWVAASQVSARPVYRGVIEHSIYVSAQARGRGVGHRLLGAFTDAADVAGVWTIQCGIFPENQASLALHAAHGFRTVGVRERIGRMSFGPRAGEWLDNILIERRSGRAGI